MARWKMHFNRYFIRQLADFNTSPRLLSLIYNVTVNCACRTDIVVYFKLHRETVVRSINWNCTILRSSSALAWWKSGRAMGSVMGSIFPPWFFAVLFYLRKKYKREASDTFNGDQVYMSYQVKRRVQHRWENNFMRSPITKRILSETPKEITDWVRLYALVVVFINRIHHSAPNNVKPD